jgi:uncharacterized protein
MAATPMHLLDANALIALSWPKHEHHAAVYRWFSRHAGNGWGSCVLTQAAFVRITSQSAFGGQARDITEVSEVLRRLVAHTAHRLLPLDFPFDEALRLCTGGVVGHRQITDACLLTAAHLRQRPEHLAGQRRGAQRAYRGVALKARAALNCVFGDWPRDAGC